MILLILWKLCLGSLNGLALNLWRLLLFATGAESLELQLAAAQGEGCDEEPGRCQAKHARTKHGLVIHKVHAQKLGHRSKLMKRDSRRRPLVDGEEAVLRGEHEVWWLITSNRLKDVGSLLEKAEERMSSFAKQAWGGLWGSWEWMCSLLKTAEMAEEMSPFFGLVCRWRIKEEEEKEGRWELAARVNREGLLGVFMLISYFCNGFILYVGWFG